MALGAATPCSAIGRLLNRIHEIQAAFAAYQRSKCSCCEADRHQADEDRLGQLLGCPRYDDDSGWNWVALVKPESVPSSSPEPRFRVLSDGRQKDTLTGEVLDPPDYRTLSDFPG